MASTGSRKWMFYEADDGSLYAQRNTDESVGVACGWTDPTQVGPNPPNDLFPRYFKPRYVQGFAQVGGVTVRRKFIMGSPDAFEAAVAAGTLTVDSVAYTLTFSCGERAPLVFGLDTAITDGTAE